ncbi:MAG: Na+/H+ antiporter [Candidatus Rokuibacteriota bacterium]|nr:MAG: Na+/H+ antiporter [Candidatus Rokubacteria bacterium]
MQELHQLETVIALLAAVLALATAARRVLIPYPIFLVLGGLVIGVVPNVPTLRLDPDLVFLIFLPPVLWSAAYFTSLRDFRANLRPITLLAVGLVLATTAVVAAVARFVMPGLSWPAAVALGAIVSPPDAVAASAIARRLGIPFRIVTVLEGESLINDAAALVLYRSAVAAVVTGAFSLTDALWQFVLTSAGGVLIGLLIGGLVCWALRLTDDSLTETAITLLAPYAAWILAERTHTSGVLACVAGGLYIRQFFSAAVAPATRIQSNAVWRLLIFVLNGVIFALIGLQLGAIREAGLSADLRTLVRLGALISIAAIAIRLIWVPLAVVIPRYVSRALRARDPIPPWPWVLLLSWIGMRGIVSLAAALALPVTTASGAPFPFRAEIILVTFAVILATLVLQGLTLTPLIRVLELGEDRTLELEEARAREEAAQAAIAHLDGLASTPWARRQDVDRLRAVYTQRIRLASPIELGADVGAARAQAAFRRLRHETLSTERRALIKLRDQGVVSDEVLHRLEQELDVEAMRIGLGETRLNDPPGA